MSTRFFSLLTVLTLFAGAARADEPKTAPKNEDVEKAKERLTEYLKGIPGTEAARVTPLTADGMAATFPDHVVFAVLFPQYPVARIAPPPLKSANVVAIPRKDGKPVPVTDSKELETFFKQSARPVKTAAEGEETIKAWLRASAEMAQDGFYKFTVKAETPKVDGDALTGTGEAAADPQGGNKGGVKANLTFKDGKLSTVETKQNLKPGVRPICQATKLLDPDPIVRGMAEQAIRVMGSAAKPYLDEQRARAPAQLREAIDRAWRRIVEEER